MRRFAASYVRRVTRRWLAWVAFLGTVIPLAVLLGWIPTTGAALDDPIRGILQAVVIGSLIYLVIVEPTLMWIELDSSHSDLERRLAEAEVQRVAIRDSTVIVVEGGRTRPVRVDITPDLNLSGRVQKRIGASGWVARVWRFLWPPKPPRDR